MIKRLLWLLTLLLFAADPFAEAQQPKKIPRIGRLTAGSATAESARTEPFRQALRELGYVEGKNLIAPSHSGKLCASLGM